MIKVSVASPRRRVARIPLERVLLVILSFHLIHAHGANAQDWTPADLSATPALWLDASDESTVTLNGSAVSQWRDKSGNERHLSQPTAAKQPSYLTAGSLQNGRNVVVFDAGARSLFAPPSVFQLSQPFSRFIVARFEGKANKSVLVDSDSRNNQSVFYNGESGSNWAVAQGIVPNFQTDAYGTRDFLDHQHFHIINGPESFWGLDGSVLTGPLNPGPSDMPGIRVGNIRTELSALYPFKGRIYEIIFLSGIISQDERELIEGYLAHKWGLEGQLRADHPYKTAAPERSAALNLQTTASLNDSNANGLPDLAETIDYTFTLRNTGTLPLSDISVSDQMAGMMFTGNPVSSLIAGATNNSITGTYTIGQADMNSGTVSSRASATGSSPDGTNDVTASSDDDSGATDGDGDGNPNNDPATIFIPADPRLSIEKTFAFITDAMAGVGDVIRYSYAVTNIGNVDIIGISITDITNGHDPDFLSGVSPDQPVIVLLTDDAGPAGDSTDADETGPLWDKLAPGDTITFTADYSVVQADLDNIP